MNSKKIAEILEKNNPRIKNPAPIYLQYIKSTKPKTEEDVMNAHKKSLELGWDY